MQFAIHPLSTIYLQLALWSRTAFLRYRYLSDYKFELKRYTGVILKLLNRNNLSDKSFLFYKGIWQLPYWFSCLKASSRWPLKNRKSGNGRFIKEMVPIFIFFMTYCISFFPILCLRFCPSIFLYLVSVCPSIVLIEVEPSNFALIIKNFIR